MIERQKHYLLDPDGIKDENRFHWAPRAGSAKMTADKSSLRYYTSARGNSGIFSFSLWALPYALCACTTPPLGLRENGCPTCCYYYGIVDKSIFIKEIFINDNQGIPDFWGRKPWFLSKGMDDFCLKGLQLRPLDYMRLRKGRAASNLILKENDGIVNG